MFTLYIKVCKYIDYDVYDSKYSFVILNTIDKIFYNVVDQSSSIIKVISYLINSISSILYFHLDKFSVFQSVAATIELPSGSGNALINFKKYSKNSSFI